MESGEREQNEETGEAFSATPHSPPSPPLSPLLPPRADRDRFGTLAKNVANPDRSCLTCVVLFLGGVLLLTGCLVYYYYANAAFHQP